MSLERRYRLVYKPLTFIGCSIPAVLMMLGIFGIAGQSLGVEPSRALLHTCGKTALNLLLITLAVTPLRRILGGQLRELAQLQRLRRMLGVFAFFYALLHLVVYVWLDQGLDWQSVLQDIVKRPYITIGMIALLLLIPLAITSTDRMLRRLGRRWQTLHRLIYVIAALGVWHYYWQVKKDVREPLLYAGILAVLLGYRVWKSRWFTSRFLSATAPERT